MATHPPFGAAAGTTDTVTSNPVTEAVSTTPDDFSAPFFVPLLPSSPSSSSGQKTVFVQYLDVDLVGHNIYTPGRPCYTALRQHFGDSILSTSTPDAAAGHHALGLVQTSGTLPPAASTSSATATPSLPYIDRRVLGQIVFGDPKQLHALNTICGPYLEQEVLQIYETFKAEAAASSSRAAPTIGALFIMEAALLCEAATLLRLTSDVWISHCSAAVAVQRVMARNGLGQAAAMQRVASQPDISAKLQLLRQVGYEGNIETFDTTELPLKTGLEEVEVAFQAYWAKYMQSRLDG